MFEQSLEEYEAIVGRVKRYAILHDLNVSTLSLLELVTGNC